MEHIFIYDKDDKIILDLEDNKISGFKFHSDNTYEPVDKSVFKYFDFLILSQYRQILSCENDYLVILDNKTNYKHYFRNGKEDYEMFFLNNGEDATVYLGDGKNKKANIKEFFTDIGKTVIPIASIYAIASLVLGGYFFVEMNLNKRDITLQEMHDLIYSSKNLSEEEKDYLYNEDLFNYVLPYVNKSEWVKYLYRNVKYKNFDIEYYDQKKYPNYGGYYGLFNKIYVSKTSPDSISHEACHVLQTGNLDYRLLTECVNELMAGEFYGKDVYWDDTGIILTRKLLETVGVDALMTYNIDGDDKLIREKISPYLDNKECNRFLYCMKEKVAKATGDNLDVHETNNALREELTVLVDKLAGKMGITFNEEDFEYGSKKYFNKKEVKEKYQNYIKKLKLKSVLEDGEFILQDILAEEKIKILKMDEAGNCLGEATVDDINKRWAEYNFIVEPGEEFRDYSVVRIREYDDFGLALLKTYKNPKYSYTTYDEFAPNDREEEQSMSYGEFYRNLEIQVNNKEKYKMPYEYLDGSTVQILDDDVVIKREVDGTEKRYTVAEGAKLVVKNNGLIYWQGKSDIIYRIIFPDGTLLEKIIVNDPKDIYGFDSQFKYQTSTGESLDIYGPTICSYTTKDGKYYMPLDNDAFIKYYDKNGNVLGTKRYVSDDRIAWYDNDGNEVMYASYTGDVRFWTMNKQKNGSSVDIDEDGVVEYYDYRGILSKVTYPNGYVVNIDYDNNISKFYNDKDELIAVKNGICLIEENGMLIIETGDSDDQTFDCIYYGKYEVFTDENDNKKVTILGNDKVDEQVSKI
jgi:hypothetical protein